MLLPLIRLQPDIITNNRLGGGYGGDLSTPEQHIPATGMPGRDWETCMTMNNTWGFKSYDHDWKSTETLIRNLVDIASKGGNYLLNVGPTAEGEIPQPSIERLRQIGAWMRVNGQSIYATTASPFHRLAWGRCTTKVRDTGVTLYLHVFEWPSDGRLLVPGLRTQVRAARLLANDEPLKARPDVDGVIVDVPAEALDAIDTVIVLELQGELDVVKVLPKQAEDGSVTLPAALAEIHNPLHGGRAQVESIDGQASIGYWTDIKSWVSWEFTIDRPGTFDVFGTTASLAASTFVVTIADTRWTTEVKSTGSYQAFKTVNLGRVGIEDTGPVTITVKPRRGQWQPINLRRSVLKPAD
jgi:alpha-L-fucosidase